MEKDGVSVIEIWDSSDEEEVEERHRTSSVFYFTKGKGIFAIKDEFKKKKKKENREFDEDCFILDHDPFNSLKKLSINDNENEDAEDLTVIAERGQVACRDFPHSRHLCAKFPFSKTPHLSHCEQCYCYVCDSIAPCKFWSDGPQEHCHATADDPKWKVLRQAGKPMSSTQRNHLDQLVMNIATEERHDSYLSYQNISVNQPTTRGRFDYDSQRDYPSSQDTGSWGEGTDKFRFLNRRDRWAQECPSTAGGGELSSVPRDYPSSQDTGTWGEGTNTFRCFSRRDRWPQECPSTAGGGRLSSVPRFNGGRAGNRNEERCINDRYKNHHRSPPTGGQYRGGYTHGNHDYCYTGDKSPPAGGQYDGGYTHENHDRHYAGDRCPPVGGQFRGGSRYFPVEGRFERGDRYDGGGAWDQNHYNGYGNDRGYDKEGGHNGAGNIWEWKVYDKDGNHDNRYAEDSCPPAGGQFRGGSGYSPTQGRFEEDDRYGNDVWDRNHHNGYGNGRGYDKEGNHDRRYAEDSCPPAGGQFRGGSRYSPTQGRFEEDDRYGSDVWDQNHHNGYGNGRGYDKEGRHKEAGNIWEWRAERDW